MSDRAQPAVTATSDPATMLTAVFNFLKQTDYSLQNLSYSYDTRNSLPASWLIQSAPGNTRSQFLETIQNQLRSFVQNVIDKPHFIDFMQMGNQNETDAFQGQLIESFNAIAVATRQKVVIRYIEGNPFGTGEKDGMTFIRHLQKSYRGPIPSTVYFYAVSFAIPWTEAQIQGLPGSWTHAKFFAIDGAASIAGGQNYWNDYLPGGTLPHDVSMQVNGAAAGAAHGFANALWNYIAREGRQNFLTRSWQLGAPQFDNTLPPSFDPRIYPPPAQPESVPVLAVGNLGTWLPGELDSLKKEAIDALTNPAKTVSPKDTYPAVMDALNRLLDFPFWKSDAPVSKATQASTTARHLLLGAVEQNGHLRISQQKIADTDLVNNVAIPFPPYQGDYAVPWPGQFMQAIVSAMKDKNATVDIIVSCHVEQDSPFGGYSDDMGAKALRGVIIDLLARALGGDTAKAQALANTLLTVKAPAYYNHAKVWILDDKVFYVGSDNIYPAYLQEYGYVIGSVQKTQEFIQNYWTPLWNISSEPS